MTRPETPPYTGMPVAVIGNGPVGQTTALLLARWGIPVVALDRRPERQAVGSKAICQQRDVLDIWACLGGTRIAEEGLAWTTSRTFYRDRELFQWSFVDRGHSSLPPFVNISQCRSEQLLDELIETQPRIDVRWDHDVVAIEQHDDYVALECHTAEGAREVRAAYVVAAGGARGDPLRNALGVTFEGRSFDDRFLVCDIRTDLAGWDHERRFYLDPSWNPGRQVLIHPCPDSVYRIDWQVPPDFDLEAETASGGLDARIRQIIGEEPYEIVWQSVYRFHAKRVDQMRIGRVLIAGDLAHLVAPFGARGLNSGVGDAENAAWKLAFVLREWAPDSLLDSYHTERLAAAEENIEITGRTMRFLVPQNGDEVVARRELLEAAVDDSEAHSRVDTGRFAEPFWYVDSPLTTPDPTRRFTGRPPRGEMPTVVPGVLIPDAPIGIADQPEVTRLREVVRSGLLAITTGAVNPADTLAALEAATDVQSRVLRLSDIDRDGVLATALATAPDEVWLVRPDGHVSAVLSSPSVHELTTAARRAIGLAPRVTAKEETDDGLLQVGGNDPAEAAYPAQSS